MAMFPRFPQSSEYAGTDTLDPGSDGSGGGSSPEVSVVVKDGIDLALSRPFIFLGLTIVGLLIVLFLLVSFAYRFLRSRQLKKSGVLPSTRQFPIQIVADRNRPRDIEKSAKSLSNSTETDIAPNGLHGIDQTVSTGFADSHLEEVVDMDITEMVSNHHETLQVASNDVYSETECSMSEEKSSWPSATVRLVTAETVKVDTLPHLPFQKDNLSSVYVDACSSVIHVDEKIHQLLRITKLPESSCSFLDVPDLGESLVASVKPDEVGQFERPSQIIIRRSKATFHLMRPAQSIRGIRRGDMKRHGTER